MTNRNRTRMITVAVLALLSLATSVAYSQGLEERSYHASG